MLRAFRPEASRVQRRPCPPPHMGRDVTCYVSRNRTLPATLYARRSEAELHNQLLISVPLCLCGEIRIPPAPAWRARCPRTAAESHLPGAADMPQTHLWLRCAARERP